MRVAGLCEICERNVYLDAWACAQGHDRSHVSGWYNADTGQPVIPPFIGRQAAPAPSLDSMTPEAAMLELLGRRIEAVGLTVARVGPTLEATRAKGYEAAVAVLGEKTVVTLWEYLAEGDDPGVRDIVRTTAGEAGWTVRVALRRPASSE